MFPIPTFLGLYFAEGTKPLEILDLDHFQWYPIAIGLAFAVLYAFFALLLMQARVFKEMPTRVEKLVQSMNLTIECSAPASPPTTWRGRMPATVVIASRRRLPIPTSSSVLL